MTSKDYKLIAEHLAVAYGKTVFRNNAYEGFELVMGALMDALQSDNPRFDRDRFETAVFASGGKQ